MKEDIDDIDRRLLNRLMRQGRATWADLAEELGLTAPAIAQRVRRLEDRGIIRQFAAWVAPEAVAPVSAYVSVALNGANHQPFREGVSALDSVQECSYLAGADEYLLKVRCRSLAELEHLVSHNLRHLPGVMRATPSVVLSTVKDSPVLPMGGIQ